MQNEQLKVVYMGTPEFAVGPLKAIVQANYNVVGVVTVPDKPAGRGRKLRTSAVKDYAVQNNIPVLQPEKLRNEDFITNLTVLNADVFVVVAFRMLPQVVWQIPRLGTFNLHASLLPQYRGAAPINWAVINGEKESGVTTFLIDQKIDTGNILLQEKVAMTPNETAGTLHDKLKEVGAELVVKTLHGLAEQSIVAQPQENLETLKQAPKLFKDDCKLDWSKTGHEIEARIRGLSPYPGAFTEVKSEEFTGTLKITDAAFVPSSTHTNVQMVIRGKALIIELMDGELNVNQLQPQGKRSMAASDFINGIRDKNQVFQLL